MENQLKVLFVSSGTSENFEIAPFIKAQGDSLVKAGVSVSYFPIKDKGFLGYLKGAVKIRKFLKENNFDIIHAHYTLSGWSAVLALPKQPIILSLMGTDTYGDYIGEDKIRFSSNYLILLTRLIQPFVAKLICKSKHIESFVYLKKKSVVIPNGILLSMFLINGNGFRKELGLEKNRRYVLFLGDKNSIRKNFQLATDALKKVNMEMVSLIAPFPVSHSEVVKYLNSVDCLVVPSLMEGSPNVVKEAMACNCPVVASNVGDVAWLFGDEPGYYTTTFDPEDVASKIKLALDFSEKLGRTNGRERIISLDLDSRKVAQRIIEVYKSALNDKGNG
ncbi:MAG: glycosyltransferase family 4 protein [Bacteroidales bacterium]|nr:glycosyltransferase family 4 protein [Bacteroidales bacterium]